MNILEMLKRASKQLPFSSEYEGKRNKYRIDRIFETPTQKNDMLIKTRRLWDMRDEDLLPKPISNEERLKRIEALKGVRKRKRKK